MHRDIKPSNIIFVKGVAKLGDIGLVTEAGDTQSIVGTEGYLPPEGPGTPQADLFSLGKVLYEAATGLDRRQLSRLPDDLRTWPDAPRVFEFNEIVLRACAKDPAERYRTVEQLRADLALLQEGKSVRRVRGKQRLWSQGKKLALGLVLLALVVAGVARLARQTQHNEADGDGKPSTNDLANMFCEKGLLILRGDNYAQLAEAYTNFHRTIELDPHFARPHVGLWELRTREVVPGLGATSPEELRMITRKLKELAPNLAATHCAESTISYHEWDFPHARESALQAIQTDPKYEAGHFLYGFMLMHWGWPVEGRAELETARKLKPSKVNIYRMLGHTFYAERNYTNAIALYREAIALEPNHAIAYLFIGQAQRAMGDYANAINNLQRAEILFGKDASEAKQRFDEYRRAIIEGGAPL